MLGNLLKSVFGSKNERELKQLAPLVERINSLEPEFQALSHEHETDLDPDFGLADLMAILETQQYGAPTSGDRDDLRKLYVQVLAALAEQVQPDEREAEKERGRRLTDLADALGRLIRYRQATNILWRTFGLRYEMRLELDLVK